MKKIFATIMGLTLGVGAIQAQEASGSKWIGTLGVAPVVLDGTGIQLGLEKAMNSKLSLGIGINTLSRKPSSFTVPFGNVSFPNGVESNTTKSTSNTYGIHARYYLIGNNDDSKFGLYGGLGLGLTNYNYVNNSKNLLAPTDTNYYSYDYESKESGLSMQLTGGLDYKISKGRIYFEMKSINMISSNVEQITSNGKGTMANQNGTFKYKGGFSIFDDLYLTLGYRLRF